MPVELISAFYLDEESSDWLIDYGAAKHMFHNKPAFHPGTFKPGTSKWVSGVKLSNGSMADILGTRTVTITTRINKRLQSLVLTFCILLEK